VIDPVELLMDSPAGRPVALQVRVAPDWVSVAELVTAVMAEPEPSACAPGLATVTVLVTVHENDVEPAYPAPSVAVTVTELTPAVVGVPEIVPVELLIDRPAGSPVAVHV